MAAEVTPRKRGIQARKAAPEIDLVPLRAEQMDKSPRPHVRKWLETFLLE